MTDDLDDLFSQDDIGKFVNYFITPTFSQTNKISDVNPKLLKFLKLLLTQL